MSWRGTQGNPISCPACAHARRSDSSAAILEVLQGAASAAAADTGSSAKMACRAHFRLAHYADSLYRNIVEQKQSPEWHTAQAVIAYKRQQASHSPSA